MNDLEIIKALVARAMLTGDPFASIDGARRAARGVVLQAVLEAADWNVHRAAARLGRTTSTIRSELENHHPELESERKRRLSEK